MAQTENMKKAQPEINRLEKKYANKTDNESLMAKSQETMMIYKKYNINPVSGCLTSFIQLPIFFAFLEAINRVPAIFEGTAAGEKTAGCQPDFPQYNECNAECPIYEDDGYGSLDGKCFITISD